MENRQWKGTTYGNSGMHRHLIRLLRVLDVRVLYVFSYLFVIPFCLIFNASRRTAWRFYRNGLHQGFFRAAWSVYANHCRFAEVVIDRFAMYAGKRFRIVVDGRDEFERRAAGEDGFLHLSSHIGNYELAGYSLGSEKKTIYAVVFADEKATVMEGRGRMFGRNNVKMIALREDMGHLFEIDEALSGGHVVTFPSDRMMGEGKSLSAAFLGRTARFPQGPFRVAVMRGVEVLAVNVMKEGWTGYHVYVTPLPYDRTLPKKEQVDTLLREYVAQLEKCIRRYPTQWYNFFDFWA